MSEIIPTVIIQTENGPVRINEDKYDPKIHKLVGADIQSPAKDSTEPKTVDDMTVNELKAHAEANKIDLGEATKKAVILEIIKKAQAPKTDDMFLMAAPVDGGKFIIVDVNGKPFSEQVFDTLELANEAIESLKGDA